MNKGRVTVEEELSYIGQQLNVAELAWAAGFFDGEGHVSGRIDRRRRSVGRKPLCDRYLYVQIGQAGSAEELERFLHAVGMNGKKVMGPYGPYGRSKKQVYRIDFLGRRAERVMELIEPFLCSRKRADYPAAQRDVLEARRRAKER